MITKLSRFLMIFLALAISGCQSDKEGEFAIYLLSQDVSAAGLAQINIDQLTLESNPILSTDDIISYDKTNHILELTRSANIRIQQIFPTPVRVAGIPFVVCVGKARIYTGAFWTPLSSLSYDGVVIMQPMDTKSSAIQITLGYPGTIFFTGSDPRADSRIMKALEQNEKLK